MRLIMPKQLILGKMIWTLLKDFWNNIRTQGCHIRKQYLRSGGSFRNHPHLFGWNHMDFKDFWYNKHSLWSHLLKRNLRGSGWFWNHPHIFWWSYMDFKDFCYNKHPLWSNLPLKLNNLFRSKMIFRYCLPRLKKFSELVNLRVEILYRTSFPLTFARIRDRNFIWMVVEYLGWWPPDLHSRGWFDVCLLCTICNMLYHVFRAKSLILCAESGTRTRTSIAHCPLKTACLPVPPPRH